ncbi:MAG: ABC transporter substrate-binding protein [Synechococcales cyanobacterium]|nr:Tat pathway signal protein [Cyanobacteria bacterium WB6_1B_304]
MKQRWLKHVLLLSVASLSLWGLEVSSPLVSQPQQSAQAQSTTRKAIKVNPSWLLQGDNAGLIMGIEKGFFASEGLDVTWERGFGSADTLAKVASGQFQFGFGDMYSMIEFNHKNPNDRLIAVAVPYNKAPFSIVTLRKSNIVSPKLLKGKKIGAPAGDAPRRLWRPFAASIGIPANSVEWLTMEPRLRETFLVKGDVDAISGFSTTIIPSLNKLGIPPKDLNVFYYTDHGLNLYGNAIIVKESFLRQNPQVVRGFLRAYIKGQQEMLKDPNTGLESVLKAGGALMDKEVEKFRLRLALQRLFLTPEVPKVGIGGVDLKRLELTIKDVAEDFGVPTPPVNQIFNGSFMPPISQRKLPSSLKPLI